MTQCRNLWFIAEQIMLWPNCLETNAIAVMKRLTIVLPYVLFTLQYMYIKTPLRV